MHIYNIHHKISFKEMLYASIINHLLPKWFFITSSSKVTQFHACFVYRHRGANTYQYCYAVDRNTSHSPCGPASLAVLSEELHRKRVGAIMRPTLFRVVPSFKLDISIDIVLYKRHKMGNQSFLRSRYFRDKF